MASMRDAMKRLEVIYQACAPEAQDEKNADAQLDEFGRLRKRIHADVKSVRQALKERDDLMRRGGTTTETAEASYKIRVMIKSLKEQVGRMGEIVDKEGRKKKQKDPEKIVEHKEIYELCKQHIEECENLEKRKANESLASNRVELLSGADSGGGLYVTSRSRGGASGDQAPQDPFTNTDLPDIDVEEDLKTIKARNQQIDEDIDYLGNGVAKLKEIAIDMGDELDKQNTDLEKIDRNVEKALDHVDNINVTLKKTLDGVMKGDKFMVNCILLCVILALVAFISTQFTKL